MAIDNLHRSVSARKAQAMRGFVVVVLALFFAVMTVTSSQYVYAARFQTTRPRTSRSPISTAPCLWALC